MSGGLSTVEKLGKFGSRRDNWPGSHSGKEKGFGVGLGQGWKNHGCGKQGPSILLKLGRKGF